MKSGCGIGSKVPCPEFHFGGWDRRTAEKNDIKLQRNLCLNLVFLCTNMEKRDIIKRTAMDRSAE